MTDLELNWDINWLEELADTETHLRQLDIRVRKVLRRRLLDIKLGKEIDGNLSGAESLQRGKSSRRPVGF